MHHNPFTVDMTIQIPNKGRGLFVDQLKSTILEKKWIFEFLLKYVT